MPRVRRLGAALGIAVMVCQSGHGQATEGDAALADSPPDIVEESGSRFRLMAAVWLPRLDGTFMLDGGSISEDQLDLDDLEATLNVELDVHLNDSWSLWAGGFSFETDGSGTYEDVNRFGDVTLFPGDEFRSSVDFLSIGAEAHYDFFRGFPDDSPANLGFHLIMGGRYIGFDQSVERLDGPRSSVSNDWFAVYGGLGFELWNDPSDWLPLIHALRIGASGAVGPVVGTDGGIVWQVRADITADITPNVGLTFGYRLLSLDVEDREYGVDSSLAGVILGATVRF